MTGSRTTHYYLSGTYPGAVEWDEWRSETAAELVEADLDRRSPESAPHFARRCRGECGDAACARAETQEEEQPARVVGGHPFAYSLALDRDVRPEIARRIAQAWLDRHKPGAQVEHVAGRYVFYGWPVAGQSPRPR